MAVGALNVPVLCEWCQMLPGGNEGEVMTLSSVASCQTSQLVTEFQTIVNCIVSNDFKSILWTSFSAIGLNIMELCENLQTPLCDSSVDSVECLSLNICSYICYVYILLIDGSSSSQLFDCGTMELALQQPRAICDAIIKSSVAGPKAKKKASGGRKRRNPSGDETSPLKVAPGGSFSDKETQILLQSVNKLLIVLKNLLSRVSLAPLDELQHSLVSEITYILHLSASSPKMKDLSKMWDPKICYEILGVYLTNPLHQTSLREDSRVMRSLLDIVLMKSLSNTRGGSSLVGSQSNAIAQYVNRSAELAITFIKDLIVAKPSASQSVFILAQHMFANVVDKAEYRMKTAEFIVSLIVALPENCRLYYLDWLFSSMLSNVQCERLLGLEIIENFLNYIASSGYSSSSLDLDREMLICRIIGRCYDRQSSIRAKALSCISALCSLRNLEIQCLLQTKLMNLSKKESHGHAAGQGSGYGTVNGDGEVNNNKNRVGGDEDEDNQTLVDESFESLFSRRCSDEKSVVRRAALLAFSNVVISIVPPERVNEAILMNVLNEASRDPSVLIRKQSIDCCISLLLAFPLKICFQQAWLNNVLPLISDRENMVVEKASKAMGMILLDPLIGSNFEETNSETDCNKCLTLAWNLLDCIASTNKHKYYFDLNSAAHEIGKILTNSSVQENVSKSKKKGGTKSKQELEFVSRILKHSSLESREAACWMLLLEAMKIDGIRIVFDEAVNQINQVFLADVFWTDSVCHKLEYILGVLTMAASSAKLVKPSEMKELINSLFLLATKLDIPMHVAGEVIRVQTILCSKFDCLDLVESFTLSSIKSLKNSITSNTKVVDIYTPGGALSDPSVWRKIHLIGQLSLSNLSFSSKCMISLKHIFNLILTTVNDSFEELLRTQAEFMFEKDGVSTMQAVAVVAIGNMCLVSEDMKRRGCHLLANLINPNHKATTNALLSTVNNKGSRGGDPIEDLNRQPLDDGDTNDSARPALCSLKVANNVIIMLCDLCKRYSHAVERYLPRVYRYLACPDDFLRFQTLACVFNLLKDEYIKLRESLFFRIITLYVDDNEQVAMLAENCLDTVSQRHKQVFFTNFIEALFFLNEYRDHTKYNNFPLEGRVFSGLADCLDSEGSTNLLTLSDGTSNQEKRLLIYQFLIRNLTDQQKFQLKCRLMSEVVGEYVKAENDIGYDSMLSDVWKIFLLKPMKLMAKEPVASPEDEAAFLPEETPTVLSVTASASSKLIETSKQTLIEQFVPILLKAREKLLAEGKGKLNKELLTLLGDFIKDNKKDVKELFQGCAKEKTVAIENDIRKVEIVPIRQYFKRKSNSAAYDASSLNSTVQFESSIIADSFSYAASAANLTSSQSPCTSEHSRILTADATGVLSPAHSFQSVSSSKLCGGPVKACLEPIPENSQENLPESQSSSQLTDSRFTVPKADLMAQIERSKGQAPVTTPVPEYLIVDQSGQNCTGTFKMEGCQPQQQQPSFGVSGIVKNEPGLSFPEMPSIKSEPMFNPASGVPANDSGFVDQSQGEIKPPFAPQQSMQQHQMVMANDGTQIKAEAGFDVSTSSATMTTSTPMKQAADAVVLANGKHQCTVCSKTFASKQGALKHASTQHNLAL